MSDTKSIKAPALDKGLKILEVLSHSQNFLTMSQIAKAMGYKVSEIQRMVEYLHHNGYINKSNLGGFYISSKFHSLASSIDFHQMLINRATPLMKCFALNTKESLQLSVLTDRELNLLAHIEGTRDLHLSVKPGMFIPMDTVSGQTLISYLPESEQAIFDLTEKELEFLNIIRSSCDSQGYWAGESSCFEGVYKLTTTIETNGNKNIAALTCSFLLPKGQRLDEYRNSLVSELMETKKSIIDSL